MLPNLLEATQEYWRKLDKLEAAYQQGIISIEEVDAEVASLMAELGRKRRSALIYFLQGCQHWLAAQRESLIGLAVLGIITYAWVLVKLSS
jgi:hypothetical protein